MNANEKKEKKGSGNPAANPSYSQQQRESPQIPFPFSRCRGNTSLIKRVHRNERLDADTRSLGSCTVSFVEAQNLRYYNT